MYNIIVVHESIKQVDLFIHNIKTCAENIASLYYVIIPNLIYCIEQLLNITTCISLLLYVSSNLS